MVYQWVKQQEKLIGKNKPNGYLIIGDEEKIKIGSGVSFGGKVVLFANHNIEIGEGTMIGINSILHTSTHNYGHHPMWIERIDKPIKIGKHVWIGANALIAPGVIVEDYAVVGAGSVVVANVPEGAIVVGNPARIIKYRDIDNKIRMDKDFKYPSGAYVTKQGYITTYCKSK